MQSIALLGIPITNKMISDLTLECIKKIQENKSTGISEYYSIISRKIIATSYGWSFSSVDDSEVLSVVRQANFSSFSDAFLHRLALSLGSQIAPLYTTEDFILALCQALGEKSMAVFFLGKDEKLTKSAGVALHDRSSQLRLVGIAAPPIFVRGEELIHSLERDALLIEQINASHADVLVVGLEETTQELWVRRVIRHLSVPLIVIAGKSLDSFAKPVSAMRVGQKNEKSMKQVPVDQTEVLSFFQQLKLSWMAVSLISYHTASRILYRCLYAKKELSPHETSQLFLSAHHSIAIMILPSIIDAENVSSWMDQFEESSHHDVLILDFRYLRHLQPEGLYFLIRVWLKMNEQSKNLYVVGMTYWIQNLLKVHRVWDLFKNNKCDSAEELVSRLQAYESIGFYDTFSQTDHLVTLSILGALDNKIDYHVYMQKIVPIIGDKNCRIDFSYCTFIDNTGFSFLLDLQKHLRSKAHTLTFASINPLLQKQFKKARVLD